MERDQERFDDELIELGEVTALTEGQNVTPGEGTIKLPD